MFFPYNPRRRMILIFIHFFEDVFTRHFLNFFSVQRQTKFYLFEYQKIIAAHFGMKLQGYVCIFIHIAHIKKVQGEAKTSDMSRVKSAPNV